jgi:hypothetical protein
MRTTLHRPRRRAPLVVAAVAALILAAGACAPAPPATGPGAVVSDALGKVAAKDLAGLRTLACAGQEDLVRNQLGLPGAVGGELLPGLDTQALLDAVGLDVTGVKLGDATITGDVAEVPVGGTIKVTFDATAMRPVLKQILAKQGGTTMTDTQLDALLKTLQAYGQDVPLDQSVRLVREGDAWKICQATVKVPGAPGSSPGPSEAPAAS